jgi:tetratricopeptide (TPR) repeat protein
VNFIYDWDWRAAEEHFQRALALNPSYAYGRAWYSTYLLALGRPDAALAEGKRALDLDPASPGMNMVLGLQLLYSRRFDEAIGQFRKTLEMGYHDAHAGLGGAYEEKQMYREAVSEYEKFAELDHGSPRSIAWLAYAQARLNQRREALRALDRLIAASKQRYVPATLIAGVYSGLGDKDQAFAWLDKAYKDRAYTLVLLKVSPVWDPLRSDQRFGDLVRRVGLP